MPHSHAQHLLRLTTIAVLALLAACDKPLRDLDPDSCYTADGLSGISWTFFGAWLNEPYGFLLTETPYERVSLFSSFRGSNLIQSPFSIPGFSPIRRIQPTQAGFTVELPEDNLALLNDRMEPLSIIDIKEVANQEHGELVSLLDWEQLPGGRIITLSHVKRTDGTFNLSLVTFAATRPESLQVLYSIALDDPATPYYLVGNTLLCSSGSTAYFLVLGAPSKLMEVKLDGTGNPQLAAVLTLESPYETIPKLPPATGPAASAAVYAMVAKSLIPKGIYCSNEDVYILRTENMSQWKLTRLDISSGKILYTKSLPLNSPHTLGAVGPQHWLFLEKGEVEAFGVQPTTGAKLIPHSWIESELTEVTCTEF